MFVQIVQKSKYSPNTRNPDLGTIHAQPITQPIQYAFFCSLLHLNPIRPNPKP